MCNISYKGICYISLLYLTNFVFNFPEQRENSSAQSAFVDALPQKTLTCSFLLKVMFVLFCFLVPAFSVEEQLHKEASEDQTHHLAGGVVIDH